MNPKDHQGDVSTTNDERSIVYTTGGDTADSLRTLVWISFDPAARLTGPWKRSGGLVTSPEAHEEVGCANGYAGAREDASSPRDRKAVHSLDHDEAGGDAIKPVVAGVSGTYPQYAEGESSTASTFILAEGASDWARVEKAMYTYLPRQYV
ncbi:hypothetical protein PG999_004538 [Apiospora kogelbergensis]|uniref:Uncharacterized protein n=1 Tax=Apiospora kogelbergensis TaxID=1337665 RepID=A0AAW0QZN4_9PEZI